MKRRGKILFIKIDAKDNYDFGFKLGSKLKEQIKDRIEKNKEMYRKRAKKRKDFSVYIKKTKKFIPSIKKNFPHLYEEVKGMADGSNIPLEKLLILMCDEELVEFKWGPPRPLKPTRKPLRCTSIAIKTDKGEILMGHNEDWWPEYRNNGLFLVDGKIKNNRFLAVGFMGNLAGSAFGMNKYGIAYTDTSLEFKKFEYKVPRFFHLRALLDLKDLKDAKKILDKEGSIVGNTLFISNSHILDIEELTSKERVFHSNRWFVHTNHPLLRADWNSYNVEKESMDRYKKVVELLYKEKKLNLNSLKRILRSHNRDICGHFTKKGPTTYSITLASAIFNPKEKWIKLCDTNPCKGKYKKYKL